MRQPAGARGAHDAHDESARPSAAGPPRGSRPARPAPAVHPARHLLGRLAEQRATGALRGPAGTVYLVDGAVQHAESPCAPHLDVLLTACGKISPQAWEESVRAAAPAHRVGRYLVENGRLTRGELELCHLVALYDAAFFALSGGTGRDAAGLGEYGFEPGAVHWLGPVLPVPVPSLVRETERRGALLDRLSDWSRLDAAAVVPRPRPVGCRRLPTPGQRRLLEAADGRRTPADIARLLGRPAYATVLDVRRLAAAGLVAAPDRPAPPAPQRRSGAAAPGGAAPAAGASASRRGSVRARAEAAADSDPGVSLLIRIRNALEARL
ncbi:transcriptional regulator [Streptomyces sp. SCUT-3]|uniref:transcriptional regulator n=1 Tax=Streptomyces sp. SCUT-3 TaxID=2684469 RepID=UPI002174F5F9|nr:transcriptional regulator [Streptomyces sp. SCUT-3]